MSDLGFTGEYMIPGEAPDRLFVDHFERYRFASRQCAGKRVLDIACGSGYGTALLADSGALSVEGVDKSEEAIEYAALHFARKNSSYLVGDIESHVSSGDSFDLITCFETIEHVKAYSGALENLRKLTKRGGRLVISSPHRWVTSPNARSLSDSPANPFHTQEFTPTELRKELVACGFSAVEMRVYGQRQRLRFPIPGFNRIYDLLFRPDSRASPVVLPARILCPRYFILIASG